MPDYPTDRKNSHFAHKLVRRMIKTCAAQQIGAQGFALVTAIAMTEDAKRYSAPVTFYNGQLLPLVGVRKWDGLNEARRRAVEAGWLHYESMGTRRAGVYWATIPPEYADLDDSPVDETIPATGDNPDETIPATGGKVGDNQGIKGGTIRVQRGGTIIPNPNPTPSPTHKRAPRKPKPTKADFDAWYAAYPRAAEPKTARKAYDKAVAELVVARGQPLTEVVAWLLTRAEAFAASDKGKSGRYCPYPATWLNKGRYDEPDETWRDATNGSGNTKRSGVGPDSPARHRQRDFTEYGDRHFEQASGTADRPAPAPSAQE
ncbi:MAG: hypothetical protein GY838_03780 [bacterium]|nr:hypothetical protein [bacterium]